MYKIYTLSLKTAPDIIKYVGLTKQSLKDRLIKHKHYGKVNTNKRGAWLKKHNENILIKEIDSCNTLEKAYKLEINYIKLYKTCGANLINGTDGGNTFKNYTKTDKQKDHTKKRLIGKIAKSVIQYDLNGNRINKFSSITEASINTNLCLQSIWKSYTNYSIVNKKYIFLGEDVKFNILKTKKYKIIETRNIETGDIKLFIGIKDAGNHFNVNPATIHYYIKSDCTFKNFTFKYLT